MGISITNSEIIDKLDDILYDVQEIKNYNISKERCLKLGEQFQVCVEDSGLDIDVEELFISINEFYIEFINEINEQVDDLQEELEEYLEESLEIYNSNRMDNEKIKFMLECIDQIKEVLEIDDNDIIKDRDIETLQSLVNKCISYDKELNNLRLRQSRRDENGLTPKQKELAELREKIIPLKEKGYSFRQIAESLNISKSKVQRILKHSVLNKLCKE